ncbi:MAG: signal peptidase I [Candidatus Nealsonbacteria bacterium]|nr:signal peptidase I [Candidatus Nealsonbacteria bacterium]
MKNKKLFYIFLAVFLPTALILFFILVFSKNNPKQEAVQEPIQALECVTSVEERTVEGTSLGGIIEPEEKVIVYFGYYKCNDPKKGDMVIIDYAGNKNPIIKIVKGVAGDSFSLKEASGGWNILVNGEVLKNSQGREYVISQGGYRMLSLYAKDYNNKIPENAFLVMGNLIGGSIDSTAFGLIGKNDIIGKAYASSANP